MLIQFKQILVSLFMASSMQTPINLDVMNDTACMAQAIFKEAANQSLAGKLAVGNVIQNRSESKLYPNKVCEVVYQKGQFQYTKNRIPKLKESDDKVYKQMVDSTKAALMIMNNEVPDNTHGATSFVNLKIATHTDWLKSMKKTVMIGEHTFYRSRKDMI